MRTALAALFRLVFSRRVQQFRGVPGPAPLFPLGNASDFLGRPPWKFKPPWLTCAEYGSRYGGLTLIWIAGRPYVVLNDGALVREVLETNAQQYYKADPIPALSPLTIPPDLFLGQRRRVAAAAHAASVCEGGPAGLAGRPTAHPA
jgi:hypothetical protein